MEIKTILTLIEYATTLHSIRAGSVFGYSDEETADMVNGIKHGWRKDGAKAIKRPRQHCAGCTAEFATMREDMPLFHILT